MKRYRLVSLLIALSLFSCQGTTDSLASPVSSSTALTESISSYTGTFPWDVEDSFVFLPLADAEDEYGVYVKEGIGAVEVPASTPDGKKVTALLQPRSEGKRDLITELVLPESIRRIQPYTFHYYPLLSRVILPNSVESVECLFQGCPSLWEVDFPESIVKVPYRAFGDCPSLRLVRLSPETRQIEASSFQYCKNLQFIEIPDTVEWIGQWAFLECESLTRVRIPKAAGAGSFAGCLSLKDVEIADGAEELEVRAFMDCPIAQVFLPSSLKKIGKNCFSSTTDLTVYCEPSERPEGWDENFCGQRSNVRYVWGAKRSDVPFLR